MRKYYTRPCNFHYGDYANQLIAENRSLPLAGNKSIAFDQVEIFERNGKKNSISKIYSIHEINKLKKNKAQLIKNDLENISCKRKSIAKLKFDRPKLMGVLNMTPDSFSDGGKFIDKKKAFKHVQYMINSGANIIDIGGESTRPGSIVLNEKEEWKRIEKTIIKIRKKFPNILLSIDTRKSYLMKKAIDRGIDIVNDVSGLRFDKQSFNTIKSKNIPFVLHHMQGTPETMQKNPTYNDVILDIFDFFEKNINFCVKANYKKNLIILDPGIGFGKNLNHNLRLISKISIFHSLGCPILIGTSRKKFIEHIVTKFDTKDRTGGTLASVLYGLSQGVQLFRVHNVKEINQGILVFKKILNTS